jgi:hypothetical protein
MPATKRVSFSVDEKIALRKQHALNPQLSQQGRCKWFEESFGKPIRQAAVSEVLSSRYSHLDLSLPMNRSQIVRKSRSYLRFHLGRHHASYSSSSSVRYSLMIATLTISAGFTDMRTW